MLFIYYDYIIRVFTWLATGSSWLSLQLVGTHCISSLSYPGSLTAKEPKMNFIGRLQRRILLINSCLVMLMVTDSQVFLRQGQDKKMVQYRNNTHKHYRKLTHCNLKEWIDQDNREKLKVARTNNYFCTCLKIKPNYFIEEDIVQNDWMMTE